MPECFCLLTSGDEYYIICYRRTGHNSGIVLVIHEEATTVTVKLPSNVPGFSMTHQGKLYGKIIFLKLCIAGLLH